MTVIQKANELIESIGKDDAIKIFEKEILELGEPKNFEDICKLSGFETAIQYIKGMI